MATKLRMLASQYNLYQGARDWALSRNGGTAQSITTTVVGGETELPINMQVGELSAFVSSPMFGDVTISSSIAGHIFLQESVDTMNATVRAKFWRVTSGGSDIESYLGAIDATTEASTVSSTATDFTGTLPSPLIGLGEKLIVRLYAIPIGAASLGAGTLTLKFNAAPSTLDSYFDFTDDIPVAYEGAGFFLRDTTILGVSGFFDLWHTPGASPVDAVVTTTASGTDIQWTLTAGGTPLAWASRRVRQKLTFTTPTVSFGATVFYPWFQGEAKESGTTVNAGVAVRIFKRNLAGTDTLLWGPYGPAAELTTTLASTNVGQKSPVGTPNLTATLDEDDRIVVRVYAVNKGTMGNGTATFRYNQVINGAGQGAAAIQLGAMGVLFKEENEPNATSRIQSGLTLGGVGN